MTKPNKFPFTAEELRELLDYNSETGIFTWKVQRGSRALVGKEAGCLDTVNGYRSVGIKGVLYSAHRLAWFYVYGIEPKEFLDHINGIKDDNRLSNLREATAVENQWNQGRRSSNTSGYKGVYWNREKQKFMARCQVNGKDNYLGLFPTAEAAHAAYVAFAKEHHGDFARTE
jgi:hypothetical protein